MTSSRTIFFSLIVLGVFVRLICFVGLIGSDDLAYNRHAYEIAAGAFQPGSTHHDTRIGLFLPVAGFFKLFGVHQWTSVAFPFLCAMALLGLILYTGTVYFDIWTGLLAGILYIFLPIDMFHATQLLPDLPAATCIAFSGVCFYRAERSLVAREESSLTINRRRGLMLLAGLFLGWAYLIKETSVFFAVFLVGYMAYHGWTQRRISTLWLWFALGAGAMVASEFGYYAWATDTPWHRYASVASGHNRSIFVGTQFQGLALLRRLTLDLGRMVLNVWEFSAYYLFALAGILYGLHKKYPFLNFLIGWFLTLVFLINFASSSLTEYAPLLLFYRFLVLLSFPGVLIVAWFFRESSHFLLPKSLGERTRLGISVSLPVLFGIVLNLVSFSLPLTGFLSVLFLLLFLIVWNRFQAWFCSQCSKKTQFLFIPLLLLSVNILPGVYRAAQGDRTYTGLTCEQEVYQALEHPLTHPVYTDHRTEAILEYFYQYQRDTQIISFEEQPREHWSQGYVVINWERLFFLNRLYHEVIPDYAQQPPAAWKLYVRIGDVNPCLIYLIP